ncbi:MAG TPA: hypothetical protein PK514_09970 [Spirochaetota bacterium]|nr:hypothetical protein [Spirochaetota bacterium]
MENKFFTFIKPYLNFIDEGRMFREPFRWVYILFAAVNLIMPLYVFYQAVDNGIFRAPAKYITIFIVVWLIIGFAGWVSFQIWWNRKDKIKDTFSESSDFAATPVFSHFIQTLGEWSGTWIGLVGFTIALLSTLLLGNDGRGFTRMLGMDFISSGIASIILMPLYGFLIIIVTRVLAEQMKVLIGIYNNTKKR